MNKCYLLSLFSLLLLSCGADELQLTVSNNSPIDRVGEIVEIDIENADQYALYTKEGDALQCQTTYEGKLIFHADVKAESTTKYILRRDRRLPLDTIATGKVYPQWFDDFGWENDKIAFRTYSEKMAERGDKLYGYDIFTKRYDRPVLDILYGVQFDKEYQATIKRLRAESPKLVQPLSAAVTYHVDHGLGMDYYVVGPTLGSGTAALVFNDQIEYPTYYDSVEILDQGGLRLTFRLTYDPVEIGCDMVQEVRTITLDKGTHFNHIEVEYKKLSTSTDLVVGLVMHDNGENSACGDGYIAYAEPKHHYGWQTYNAVIYPDEVKNRIQYFDEPKGTAQGHILSEGVYTPGEKLSYYMGAGWNRWGFKTPQEWFDYVKEQREVLKTPLTYRISKFLIATKPIHKTGFWIRLFPKKTVITSI